MSTDQTGIPTQSSDLMNGVSPPERRPSRWHLGVRKAKGTIVAVAAVGAVLSGLAGYWTTFRTVATVAQSGQGSPAVPVPPLSILVLPFVNQTGDDRKAYVADGLTTSITSDLSRIRDAFVAPVTTAFAYKNNAMTVQQVGKDAAVRFVLAGSVMASGDALRIAVQLADTTTGAQLWNEIFEGELGNLFTLQDQVTARIGNTIGEHMVIAAARESETHKTTPTVAELVLRARALSVKPQSLDNFKESERLYRKALQEDPRNVGAMAGLAATLAIHAVWLDNSDPAKDKQFLEARNLALKVKELEPDNARIYVPLAIYAMQYNDFEGARRAYEMHVAHDPKNPNVYNNFALYFREMGEPQQSIPLLQKALSLYPKGNEAIFANLGSAYLALGDNDQAIEWLLKATDENTNMLDVYSDLAIAYSNKGDGARALVYSTEFRKRAAAVGFKGIDSRPLDPVTPVAYAKYYNERYLPQWRKAGLP